MGRADFCPKAEPPPQTIRGNRQKEHRHVETTVGSDGHFEIGQPWSDQRHLDCFRYS